MNGNVLHPPASTPDWLYPRYSRALHDLGATASEEQIHQACLRLLQAWSSTGRHHHDIRHVCALLTRLGEIISQTHNPATVVLAAFYHGAVFTTEFAKTYTRNGGEDEAASADFARRELAALGLEKEVVEKVGALIENLKHREDTEFNIDLATLQDAHLGSLAVDPRRYTKYLDEVGAEYSHIPVIDFLTARQEIAKRLLARKHLFHSPLGQKWEQPARENLNAEIGRIKKRLAALAEPTSDDKQTAPAEEFHTNRMPALAERVETSTMSSLETIPDLTAKPHHDSIVEAKKQAEREDIARRMKERMNQRGQVPLDPPSPQTPEQVTEEPARSRKQESSESSGMEREPDM